MVRVKFKYRDVYCYPKWNEQECIVESIEECIKIYGLNEKDVDYVIISVKKV